MRGKAIESSYGVAKKDKNRRECPTSTGLKIVHCLLLPIPRGCGHPLLTETFPTSKRTINMRALSGIALLLAAAAGPAFSWPSPQDLLPTLPTPCLQLESAFNGVNTDLFLDSIQAEVCDRGCPLVLDEYRTKLRDQYIEPIWIEVAERMGASEHTDTLGHFLDDLYTMAETQCSNQIAWDQDMCIQTENWPAFMACVQRNAWPLLLRNSLKFLPLLSQNFCTQSVSLLRSQEILTQIVPGHLARYGLECPA